MTKFRIHRPTSLLIFACLACYAMIPPSLAAAADPATQTARSDGDIGANSHDIVQGTHVEGHIAFLRTELGITPSQEQLWAPVAAAMREDVHNLQEADAKAGQKQRPDNALEYLENRVIFANLRAQGEARFLAALQPLYNNFSPLQKQMADSLLIPAVSE